MSCGNRCKICDRIIFSVSISVVAGTLVIDIPEGSYRNGKFFCLVLTQAIPTTATISMPVAISIGGVTTTLYPLTRCDGSQVVASALRTRTRYPMQVVTSATGGSFRVLRNLSCAPNTNLSSLPVTTAAAAVAVRKSVVPAVAPAADTK